MIRPSQGAAASVISATGEEECSPTHSNNEIYIQILATTYYNLWYAEAVRDWDSVMKSSEYGLDF